MKRKQLLSFTPIISMLLIFIIDLVLILTTHQNWNASMQRYIPLKIHIGQINNNLAVGHLWLEEAISGDSSVDYERDIFQLFRNNVSSNREFISTYATEFSSPDDLRLFNQLQNLQQPLEEFHKMALRRMADVETHRIGSRMDESFDAKFRALQLSITSLNRLILYRLEAEFSQRNVYFKLILALFLLVNIALFSILFRTKYVKDRYEQELLQMRSLLRNVIDSMPSVLVGVDKDGKVIQWNQQAVLMTGITANEANGRTLTDIYPQLSGQMRRVRQAILEHKPQHDDRVVDTHDGEENYMDISIYPLRTDSIEGAVIRIDDVTKRVRIEEMMIQSEKMLSIGGLAAGMAHEINNPLAGILQNLQVIRNRLKKELPKNRQAAADSGVSMEAIEDYMQERGISNMMNAVMDSAMRAAKIVDNMLSFSRMGSRRQQSMDIAGLLDRTVELAANDYNLREKFDFKKIHIIREYEASLPEIPGEVEQLQQVFLNILKNGAQAMAEQTRNGDRATFILSLHADTEFLNIGIEDNGPGMSEEIRKRIFEPFFTTKAVGTGTGLGLSVSYFIISKYHHGELLVESTPGEGSKFNIRLPLGS